MATASKTKKVIPVSGKSANLTATQAANEKAAQNIRWGVKPGSSVSYQPVERQSNGSYKASGRSVTETTPVITPEKLQTVPEAEISVPKNDNTDWMSMLTQGTAGLAGNGLEYDAKTMQLTPSQQGTDPTLSFLQNLMNETSNTTDTAAIERQAWKDSGVDRAQRDLNSATTQLNAITTSAQQQQLALENQGRGITTDILDTQAYEISRRAAIAALPLQAQLAAAQGNLDLAKERYNMLFQVRAQDAQAKYTARVNTANSLLQYATNQQAQRLEMYKFEKQQQFQMDMENLGFEHQKQMLALQESYKKREPVIPTTRDFTDGTTRQWNPTNGQWEILSNKLGDGVITPEQMEQQLTVQETDINTIDSLKTHEGMKKAVGTNIFARWTPLKGDVLSGEVGDFVASVDQMTKGLTLDELSSAKERGVTFGALNFEELKLVADSATKINSWRRVVKDKDDNVTGTYYKASEKHFKKELDTINNFKKLDYVLNGGSPQAVGVAVMQDGTYWTQNSDGTYTKLR